MVESNVFEETVEQIFDVIFTVELIVLEVKVAEEGHGCAEEKPFSLVEASHESSAMGHFV